MMRTKIKGNALTGAAAAVLIASMPLNGVLAAPDGVEIDEKNFPDERFREYVTENFDRDGDGILSSSESDEVTQISVESMNIGSLKGIENFKKIDSLYCWKNDLEELDLAANTELEEVCCFDNKLQSLDLGKNKKVTIVRAANNKLESVVLNPYCPLTEADLSGNSLISVDLKTFDGLKSLDLSKNKITSIDLTGNAELVLLDLKGNKISELDLSGDKKLETAILSDNSLNNVGLKGLNSLKYLDLSGNDITSIDTKDLLSLEKLYLGNNKVGSLDIAHSKNLLDLRLEYCPIKSLDLKENTLLEELRLTETPIEELDLTGLSKLKILDLRNTDLKSLDISPAKDLRSLSITGSGIDKIDIHGNKTLMSVFEKSVKTEIYDAFDYKSEAGELYAGKNTAIVTMEISDEEDGGTTSDFVNRIYKYVLGREPEKEGAKFWTEQLDSHSMSGAAAATGFIFSDEFESRKTSDREFVTILYNTFFGRAPELGGLEFWLSELTTGNKDREAVARDFIFSDEWASICKKYNILSGTETEVTAEPEVDPSSDTVEFVKRMYTCALERDCEEGGLKFWTSQLAEGEMTGEACGANFFLSSELLGSGISDADYIYRLYATFMDRVPEVEGLNSWLKIMAESGTEKYKVAVYGFTRSSEFCQRCESAGIKAF